MRVLVQRVSRAEVRVAGEVIGRIGPGLLLLVGVHGDDTEAEAAWMAKKCAVLRIFRDDQGRMNRSLVDVGGEALVVSQFTLYGNVRKGTRPSFVAAGEPERADRLYESFRQLLSAELDKPVPGGVFGARMEVELINDGPVTLMLEKDHPKPD
jgi:D-tyrosyl-tRNA(Tyr) deacylase